MYITYHKKIERPEDIVNSIPHEILSEELRSFIKENGYYQKRYYFDDNGYYFFLYLDKGDRIDICIK